MSRHGLFRVLLLASLASLSTSIAACAAGEAADEELVDDGAEQALSSCKLGPQCATQQLLLARSYLNGPPPKVTRPDVIAIIPDAGSVVPRQFSRKTTGVLELGPSGRLTLSGNKEGTAPIAVDDFLLVEVLGLDGRVIGSGVASPAATEVKLSGQTVGRVAEPVPWVGINQGFVFAAGAIDITRIVPRNTPFRLRTTAFDYAGVALTSEVHLTYDASTPVPVVTDNPWDPAYCTGAPITDAEALARFAPSATSAQLSALPTAWMRKRTCHPVTGCGAWGTTSEYPILVRRTYNGLPNDFHWLFAHGFAERSLNIDATRGPERFSAAFSIQGRNGTLSLRKSFGNGVLEEGYWNLAITSNRAPYVEPRALLGVEFNGALTNHCARLTSATKVGSDEHEVVVFSRY